MEFAEAESRMPSSFEWSASRTKLPSNIGRSQLEVGSSVDSASIDAIACPLGSLMDARCCSMLAKTLRDSFTCRHGYVMIVAKSVESSVYLRHTRMTAVSLVKER